MPDVPSCFGSGLFPFRQPTTHVSAEGTCDEGGRVAIDDHALSLNVDVELPQVEFSLLFVLMDRALAAQEHDGPPAAAFVSKSLLFDHLKQLVQLEHPQAVVRSVYRLRERLGESVRAKLGDARAHAWSRTLIESSLLGYRVSVPPRQLRTDVWNAGTLQPLRLAPRPTASGGEPARIV